MFVGMRIVASAIVRLLLASPDQSFSEDPMGTLVSHKTSIAADMSIRDSLCHRIEVVPTHVEHSAK